MLQKYAVRIVCGLSRRDSCRDAFKNLKILTLSGIYIYEACIYAYKNKNIIRANRADHRYDTRFRELLLPESHSSAFYQKTCAYNSCKFYNSLPVDIRDAQNIAVFRRRLKQYLVDKCCYTLQEYLI